MKIIRTINGIEYEFELTYSEMTDAYNEYEEARWVESIDSNYPGIFNEDEVDELVEEIIDLIYYRNINPVNALDRAIESLGFDEKVEGMFD